MADDALLRYAHELRDAALLSEHLLLCVSGCSADDAKLATGALQKIARIKLQMSNKHQVGVAHFHDTRLTILQEFTRDAVRVGSALDRVVTLSTSEPVSNVSSMDDLLRDAGQYFASCAHQQCVFRLALLYRHDETAPAMRFALNEPSSAFLTTPQFYLDAIYWHAGVANELAQRTFDELCAFESKSPFVQSYLFEVGASHERLFQAFALLLAHPAHRASQDAVETLLTTPLASRPID